MITCFIDYTIDSAKTAELEVYARMWIRLVNEMGGTHHGYFLPSEGASDRALALFSFPSLAKYEAFRREIPDHPGCREALAYADEHKLLIRWDRTFMRPVLE